MGSVRAMLKLSKYSTPIMQSQLHKLWQCVVEEKDKTIILKKMIEAKERTVALEKAIEVQVIQTVYIIRRF